MPDISELIANPSWVPHKLDHKKQEVIFLNTTREMLASGPFIANLEPSSPEDIEAVSWESLRSVSIDASPPVFIFHTAFCRSTLLCKALDIPGSSIGLSEPGILNDLAGADASALNLLPNICRLLGRPWETDGIVFVKPSNHANSIIPSVMKASPQSQALLLSSSLPAFLSSVHRKGFLGRNWARRLYLEIQSYAPLDLGMERHEQFAMSDLQVAGLAWLLNRRWFAIQQAGPEHRRFHTLDAGRLVDRQSDVLVSMFAMVDRAFGKREAEAIANGPAFTRHSKRAVDFEGAFAEEVERSQSAVVAEEIEKMGIWVADIAARMGLSLDPPRPLIA